jgi:hypothetical protein
MQDRETGGGPQGVRGTNAGGITPARDTEAAAKQRNLDNIYRFFGVDSAGVDATLKGGERYGDESINVSGLTYAVARSKIGEEAYGRIVTSTIRETESANYNINMVKVNVGDKLVEEYNKPDGPSPGAPLSLPTAPAADPEPDQLPAAPAAGSTPDQLPLAALEPSPELEPGPEQQLQQPPVEPVAAPEPDLLQQPPVEPVAAPQPDQLQPAGDDVVEEVAVADQIAPITTAVVHGDGAAAAGPGGAGDPCAAQSTELSFMKEHIETLRDRIRSLMEAGGGDGGDNKEEIALLKAEIKMLWQKWDKLRHELYCSIISQVRISKLALENWDLQWPYEGWIGDKGWVRYNKDNHPRSTQAAAAGAGGAAAAVQAQKDLNNAQRYYYVYQPGLNSHYEDALGDIPDQGTHEIPAWPDSQATLDTVRGAVAVGADFACWEKPQEVVVYETAMKEKYKLSTVSNGYLVRPTLLERLGLDGVPRPAPPPAGPPAAPGIEDPASAFVPPDAQEITRMKIKRGNYNPDNDLTPSDVVVGGGVVAGGVDGRKVYIENEILPKDYNQKVVVGSGRTTADRTCKMSYGDLLMALLGGGFGIIEPDAAGAETAAPNYKAFPSINNQGGISPGQGLDFPQAEANAVGAAAADPERTTMIPLSVTLACNIAENEELTKWMKGCGLPDSDYDALRGKLGKIFQTVLRKYDIFGRILADGTCVWEPHDLDESGLQATVKSQQDHLPISLIKNKDVNPEKTALRSEKYKKWVADNPPAAPGAPGAPPAQTYYNPVV